MTLRELKERQIREKACTVCNGLRLWGLYHRAVSKKRCDTCGDSKINFKEG